MKNGNKKEEGSFDKGTKNGAWVFYYDNANKHVECNFKDDRLDGKSIEYYEIGTVSAEKSYKAGIKEGEWTFYAKREGEVLKKIRFKEGLQVQ